MEVNGKNAIVNGSINPSLSVEELTQFDVDTKRQILWCLKVGSDFAHHYNEIDPSVFVKLDYPLTYKQIEQMTGMELDREITALTSAIERHELKMKAATWELLFQIGQEFHEANKRFRLRGYFGMPLAQLCGYIKAIGQWNDFQPDDVISVLQKLDETFPRVDYGPNNPNTGMRQHSWLVSSDTIKIKVDYCKPAALDKIQAWLKTAETMIRVSARADEVSLYTKDFDFGSGPQAHEVTIRLWWD